MGILRAVLDAIMGGADLAGGRAVTKLTAALADTDTATMAVESTLKFGEWTDGAGDSRLLVGGEIITGTSRTSVSPFTFTTLTRGVGGTEAKDHPIGTLVLDISGNRSALSLVRRGFLVDFAVEEDLDIIARNLGLGKCPSLDLEAWRRIIKTVAYLPKTTVDAFEQAMLALTDDATTYTIIERLITNPYEIFVELESALVSADPLGIRGRFIVTGGFPTLTDGALSVTVNMFGSPVNLQSVNGVYDDTIAARRGLRGGLTNYFTAGSFVSGTAVITLGSSPGASGTAVLVDFQSYGSSTPINYHYLGTGFGSDQVNLAIRYDPAIAFPTIGPVGQSIQTVRLDDGDRWAYLSDPTLAARCLLSKIRQSGTKVTVSTKL